LHSGTWASLYACYELFPVERLIRSFSLQFKASLAGLASASL
jgi:hypothetical protein